MHLAELDSTHDALLRVGGVPATELVARFGSPLYAYDSGVMRARLASVRAALGDRVDVFYAIKANSSLGVVRVFRDEGVGAEVASAGEVLTVLAAGFDGARVQFAGPGKSVAEIELAVRRGVGRLNIESQAEYETIADVCRRLSTRQGVAVRINPSEAVTGARMQMGGGSQKFGVDVDQLADLLRRMASDNVVDLLGLHVYGGTQSFDADAWVANARQLVEMANALEREVGVELPDLNFGGGFGVGVHEGDPTFDLGRAGRGIRELIASDARPSRGYHVELGRYLVATSGAYLCRVIRTKVSAGRAFAILDGGMQHHAAAAGLGSIMRRSFPIVACHDVTSEDVAYRVGGPLCTPADEFSSEARLAPLQSGDVVAVLASGAYGLSFSNVMFLSHPLPAEVLVDGGVPHLIRDRGAFEDCLRGQRMPSGAGDA